MLLVQIIRWAAIISQIFAIYYYGSPEHLHIGWVAIFSVFLHISLLKTDTYRWLKE